MFDWMRSDLHLTRFYNDVDVVCSSSHFKQSAQDILSKWQNKDSHEMISYFVQCDCWILDGASLAFYLLFVLARTVCKKYPKGRQEWQTVH